ncbi:hypothetical protein CEN49_24945 [Fischerella thermalis CCMEE 5273]|nr:hypothetical protein CEN49_24945 [Fischerella thermalis CCMEE 5273]
MNVIKKKLGEVPVDSGQLAIIDPSSISGWKKGESIAINFWGEGADQAAILLEQKGMKAEKLPNLTYMISKVEIELVSKEELEE